MEGSAGGIGKLLYRGNLMILKWELLVQQQQHRQVVVVDW